MDTLPKIQQEESQFPQIRTNKHFRIKSNSKQKILIGGGDLLTTRSKRKSSIDQAKRIFSQSRNRKNSSIQSSIKIKITKEQLQKKIQKRPHAKKIAYEGIKTDQGTSNDEIKIRSPMQTINFQQSSKNINKIVQLIDVQRLISKQKFDKIAKITAQQRQSKMRKEKVQKQGKGKYRCRVNQYIFDQSRKKSNHCSKQQQETINQFWKNVNQSLILGGNEVEEASKDLRQFVQHFTTQ